MLFHENRVFKQEKIYEPRSCHSNLQRKLTKWFLLSKLKQYLHAIIYYITSHLTTHIPTLPIITYVAIIKKLSSVRRKLQLNAKVLRHFLLINIPFQMFTFLFIHFHFLCMNNFSSKIKIQFSFPIYFSSSSHHLMIL